MSLTVQFQGGAWDNAKKYIEADHHGGLLLHHHTYSPRLISHRLCRQGQCSAQSSRNRRHRRRSIQGHCWSQLARHHYDHGDHHHRAWPPVHWRAANAPMKRIIGAAAASSITADRSQSFKVYSNKSSSSCIWCLNGRSPWKQDNFRFQS